MVKVLGPHTSQAKSRSNTCDDVLDCQNYLLAGPAKYACFSRRLAHSLRWFDGRHQTGAVLECGDSVPVRYRE